MNLETIETQSVNYLTQVSNPLVRIEVLFAHLRDRGLADDLDTVRLITFLERHPSFRVMHPASGLDLDDAVTPMSAYVILATRVPTQAQISAMMFEQLLALEEALVAARLESIEREETPRTREIESTLHRLSALRKRLEAPTEGNPSN